MNEREVTFKVQNHSMGNTKIITATVADTVLAYYGPLVLKEFASEVQRRLVEMWLEQHGAAMLEQLAPGALAGTIKAKLEAEIAKKVLG